MSYSQPPPGDEPTPSGSSPPPPPEEPAAAPPPAPPEPGPSYEAPPPPAGSPAPAGGMSSDDLKRAMQEANNFDIGIVVIGVVTFLLSFFPYYTFSGFNWSAWHGFFGWFAAFIVLAAAGLLAAHMMGIKLLEPSLLRLTVLGGFAAALLCVILALFVDPSGIDWGRGFGYWVSLILVIAGTVLAFMRKDAVD